MIICTFIGSVPFYVIAAVVAAAVVALCARPVEYSGIEPQSVAPVEAWFDEEHLEPAVEFVCRQDGCIEVTRYGMADMTSTAKVVFNIAPMRFNLVISEVVTSPGTSTAVNAMKFIIGPLARERYHIKYVSESADRVATTYVHNRPDIRVMKPLT